MQATQLRIDDSDLIADVLSFWLGRPAEDAEALNAKFMRWYQGGETMDAQVRQRYSALIERALRGELEHWRMSKSGRLALIVMLDQFTRNIYRATPRAYAGDARALELALEVLRDGSYETYSQEEQLFVSMPLVHAEDYELLTRAVGLAAQLALSAAEPLQPSWARGYERVKHYRSIIARFGRFPHRNGILGRVSTPAELTFLAES